MKHLRYDLPAVFLLYVLLYVMQYVIKKHGEAVRQRLPAAVAEVTALSLISQQPVVLWQHVNMQKKKKTLRLYNWLALIHIHTVIGPLRLLHAHST